MTKKIIKEIDENPANYYHEFGHFAKDPKYIATDLRTAVQLTEGEMQYLEDGITDLLHRAAALTAYVEGVQFERGSQYLDLPFRLHSILIGLRTLHDTAEDFPGGFAAWCDERRKEEGRFSLIRCNYRSPNGTYKKPII